MLSLCTKTPPANGRCPPYTHTMPKAVTKPASQSQKLGPDILPLGKKTMTGETELGHACVSVRFVKLRHIISREGAALLQPHLV